MDNDELKKAKEEVQTIREASARRQRGAWIFTLCWLVVTLLLLLCIGWPEDFSLNAFGDFLAGMMAPLALLWLVVAYYRQGDEIRLSVSALMLQVEELRDSVMHQQELANAAKAQLDLLAQEKLAGLLPNFDITGQRMGPSPAIPAGMSELVLTLANRGPGTAYDFEVLSPMPSANFEIVSALQPGAKCEVALTVHSAEIIKLRLGFIDEVGARCVVETEGKPKQRGLYGFGPRKLSRAFVMEIKGQQTPQTAAATGTAQSPPQ